MRRLLKNRLTWFFLLALFVGGGAIVYAKFKRRKSSSNSISVSLIPKKNYSTKIVLGTEFFDLENAPNEDKSIDRSISSSGIKSTKLSLEMEYGYTIHKKMKDIPSFAKMSSIQVEFKAWCKDDISTSLYVLAIDGPDGKNISWDSKPINAFKKNEWGNVRVIFSVPTEALQPECSLKLYPWNKGKKEFYLDDFLVTYNANNVNDSNKTILAPETNFVFDFETTQDLLKTQTIAVGTAHSGRYSCDLTGMKKFSPAVVKQIGEVCTEALKRVSASVWVYPIDDNINITLETFVLNGKEESLFWDGKSIEGNSLPKNQWSKVNATFVLPYGEFSLDDFICLDVWNKGGSFFVDDLEIIYGEEVERRGAESDINPNELYDHKFAGQRNRPPFENLFLSKVEIGNKSSTRLINSSTNPYADFAPGDEYLVGNFCQDPKMLDEIIHFRGKEAAVFGYSETGFEELVFGVVCPEESGKTSYSEKIAGNFSGTGVDKLLTIDIKKKLCRIIGFPSKADCKNKAACTVEWTNTDATFGDWTLSENDKFFATELTGDKRSELLIVNSKTGAWGIYEFDGKKWNTNAKSKDTNTLDPLFLKEDKSVFVAGHFGNNLSKQAILVSKPASKNDVAECFLLKYDAAKQSFSQEAYLSENTRNLFFPPKTKCFALNMDSDAEDELLSFSTDWRFDLKLINIDEKGPVMTNNVDFEGYEADHNPKYYEFVKILPGCFIDANNPLFLVMMRNCSDKNFDGINCTQYENVKSLPNSTLLFSPNNTRLK